MTRVGISPAEALSKRSRAYKELGLADRELGDDELLDLMVENPTLLRRPLIVGPEGSLVGFNRDRLAALVEQEPG